MARHKTYTANQQTGEEGQTLAAATITGLGHIWHDRRIDHGIDAEIELVDPIDRRPLNAPVLVQSKAKAGPFPGETDTSFHFLVTSEDIAYWRGGPNKVIVVCSRPADGEIWWAPAERATPPRPGHKSWRLEFDKHTDRLDENSIGRLLHWAADGSAGRVASGRVARAETLETNLIPVLEMPPEIFFGPTWKADARQLGPALRQRGYYRSDWIVRGGVVFTFTRPDNDGLGAFLDGGYETIETTEWAESKDAETTAQFAELLRQSLIDQEHRDLRYHGKKRYFYFRAARDGGERRIKISKRGSGRTVFRPYFKDDEETEVKDCRHHAAEIRFVRTDAGWAAQINPTYHYTFDGDRDLPWGPERLKGMKRLERNSAVRGLLRFWAGYLARPAQLGQSHQPLRFGELIELTVDVGINDTDWKPPPAGETESGSAGSDQMELLS